MFLLPASRMKEEEKKWRTCRMPLVAMTRARGLRSFPRDCYAGCLHLLVPLSKGTKLADPMSMRLPATDRPEAPGGVGRRLTRQERVDTIYTLVPPSARTDPPDDRPPFLSRRTPKTHRLRPRVPRALKASWAAAKAWRTHVYNEPSTKPWRSNAVSAQP